MNREYKFMAIDDRKNTWFWKFPNISVNQPTIPNWETLNIYKTWLKTPARFPWSLSLSGYVIDQHAASIGTALSKGGPNRRATANLDGPEFAITGLGERQMVDITSCTSNLSPTHDQLIPQISPSYHQLITSCSTSCSANHPSPRHSFRVARQAATDFLYRGRVGQLS